MISISLALSLITPPSQSLSTLFQAQASPGGYVTVTVSETSPAETVSGYKFNVVPGPGGTLPLVRRDLGEALRAENSNLELYKKRGDGSYQLYCNWDTVRSAPQDNGGLLLSAGEYLYKASVTGPLYDSVLLLGGDLLTPSQQADVYTLTPIESVYTTVSLQGGQAARGFRFLVKTRENGQYPTLNQITTYLGWDSEVTVYRRLSRLVYSRFLKMRASSKAIGGGPLLSPGEYVLGVPDANTRPAPYYSGAVIVTGRYGSDRP